MCLGLCQHVLEMNRKFLLNIIVNIIGTQMSGNEATIAFIPEKSTCRYSFLG